MNRNVEKFTFMDDPAVELDAIILGGSRGKILEALESTCAKIPLDQRQLPLDWWRKFEGHPIIAFLDATHIEVVIGGQKYIALGACEDVYGINIQFAGRASYSLAPQILETLIAHEFAHAALAAEIAQGTLSNELRQELDAAAGDPIKESAWHEKHADRRAKEWNAYFDCAALRKRHREYTHRLFPDIPMDQLTGPPHEKDLEEEPEPPPAELPAETTGANQPVIPLSTLNRRFAYAILAVIVLVVAVSLIVLFAL